MRNNKLREAGSTRATILIFLTYALRSTEEGRVPSSQVEPISFQVSDAAKVYSSLVRDKYKEAEAPLAERLGEANWQRLST